MLARAEPRSMRREETASFGVPSNRKPSNRKEGREEGGQSGGAAPAQAGGGAAAPWNFLKPAVRVPCRLVLGTARFSGDATAFFACLTGPLGSLGSDGLLGSAFFSCLVPVCAFLAAPCAPPPATVQSLVRCQRPEAQSMLPLTMPHAWRGAAGRSCLVRACACTICLRLHLLVGASHGLCQASETVCLLLQPR